MKFGTHAVMGFLFLLTFLHGNIIVKRTLYFLKMNLKKKIEILRN
jgi:hypothetical protein